MAYGLVPHPGFQDRPIQKAEGNGWNNLGKRSVRGVVLHRMYGSLWGTDTYFRDPSVGALTDYGVGCAEQDGLANDGVILRWNDPLGLRAGWASGPVQGAYGDGLAFVNKYGVNAVNKDQVSIEISGKYETPVTELLLDEVAALVAYWADQAQIPYTKFPISPVDGFSFVRWHQEFTLGSGKICPGRIIMEATPRIIEKAKAIMKRYQTASTPAQQPSAPQKPTKPGAIPANDGKDHMLNKVKFWYVDREVQVTAPTKCHAFADPKSGTTRPDLAKGDTFTGTWIVRGDDSKFWWVTEKGTRISMSTTSPKITITS